MLIFNIISNGFLPVGPVSNSYSLFAIIVILMNFFATAKVLIILPTFLEPNRQTFPSALRFALKMRVKWMQNRSFLSNGFLMK